MKNFKKLSKEEMKKVTGGKVAGCKVLGSPCLTNAECCPNFCKPIAPGQGVCANP
ncbi:bacteriocin-like protein [Mucilaginibacter pineti]|uniref:bacteriocin-like protein n=1 Tax=Mucilaginibacter pineti TaxID=1391627 RepID=UPI00115FE95D